MPLSFEVLLMLGVVGLYLYDSALLLRANEAVLEPGRAGRWRAHFGFRDTPIRGGYVFLPNPLLPHRPRYRVSWQPGGVASAEPENWLLLRNRFAPLAIVTWFMMIAMFLLLPLGLFTRLGDRMVLSAIGLLYAYILIALFGLWRSRELFQLSRKECLSLALESLLCSPFALNLIRKISSRMSIREDLLHAAPPLLTAADWQAAKRVLVAVLDEEIELLDEGSERRARLQTQRDQLMREPE